VCEEPGKIVKPPPSNIITVPGEHLQFTCLVEGREDSSFYSSWNVSSFNASSQQSEVKNIHDNFTNPNYLVTTYPIVMSPTNCEFANQLTILSVSLELNGANFTCIESLDEDGKEPLLQQSVSTVRLSKLQSQGCML